MLALLGVDIPPIEGGPVFVTALTFHVLAGMTAVASAIVASFSRKRLGRHPKAGHVYLGALAVVAASAITMSSIRWHQDRNLFVIALVAAALGWLGWRARRRRRPGWQRWHGLGMAGSFITLLTGFYVDNGARLPLWNLLPSWAFWIIPSLIGWPLTVWALRRNGYWHRAGRLSQVGLP